MVLLVACGSCSNRACGVDFVLWYCWLLVVAVPTGHVVWTLYCGTVGCLW